MAFSNPGKRFYQLLKNGGTVPRWIIFILDVFICAFSLFFAYLLRFNLDFEAVQENGFVFQILLVTGMNIIFFSAFRTYEGIIRLSSIQEGIRCVMAIFYASFGLLLTIGVCTIFQLPYLIPISVLTIYFFTASFLIIAYRICIKHLYLRSLKKKFIVENVLIFGKTIDGTILKKAIESIAGHNFKVVGFVESNKNLWGKSIDNAKIYSFAQIKTIALRFNLKFLFLAADIDIETKNEVADYCLARKISIRVIPAIEDWVNGQLQSRQIKSLKIDDLLERPSINLPPEHVHRYLTGKRILITGAAGSIGSEIVKQLVGIKVERIILCDNRETACYELQYQLQQISTPLDDIIISICDVRNREAMQHLFETHKPQIVFHAAAYKHVPLMEMNPCEAIKNNVLGTRILADLSEMYGVERFVFISTDKAVNPTNVMGASKRIAEMYIGELQARQQHIQRSIFDSVDERPSLSKKSNTRFIITRFGNVLGSDGSVIPRFRAQIEKGGPVTVTHPEIVRYFMTIPEACSLVLEAAVMGKGGEIFVFDMGEPVKIVDLAKKMIKLEGLIPGKDIHIEFTGLRPGEKLYEELLNKDDEVIPTHHKKIMISRVINNGLSVISAIGHLLELAEKNKNIFVVKQMKLIVSEYKSENSDYKNLDVAENSELISVSL